MKQCIKQPSLDLFPFVSVSSANGNIMISFDYRVSLLIEYIHIIVSTESKTNPLAMLLAGSCFKRNSVEKYSSFSILMFIYFWLTYPYDCKFRTPDLMSAGVNNHFVMFLWRKHKTKCSYLRLYRQSIWPSEPPKWEIRSHQLTRQLKFEYQYRVSSWLLLPS